MKRIYASVLVVFVLMLLCISITQAQSPQDILTQYIADLQKNPSDYALREKIIKHVQTMKPALSVPEDAKRYMARGKAAFKDAKGVKDFNDAADEFKRAVLYAPWLAEGYYNLGVVQDKAGLFADAMQSLKFYLMAAPNAPDAEKVKELIYEIEYRKDKTAKESSPQAMAEKKRMTEEEFIKKINGARYVFQFRDEEFPTGGDTTIDVQGNSAILGIILNWTRDGRPVQGFPFGVWKKVGSDGYIKGRQIIIPEQSWSNKNGSWFPHDPLVCAISEDGNTLTCTQTIQTGRQVTNLFRRQR